MDLCICVVGCLHGDRDIPLLVAGDIYDGEYEAMCRGRFGLDEECVLYPRG